MKTTADILSYLSDATDCAVIRVTTKGPEFRNVFGALLAHESGWENIEYAGTGDKGRGPKRCIVVVERLKDDAPTATTPTTVQRS